MMLSNNLVNKTLNKNNLAEAAWKKNIEVVLPHIKSLAPKITIYLIITAKIFFLSVEKVIIPTKYLNFEDIF